MFIPYLILIPFAVFIYIVIRNVKKREYAPVNDTCVGMFVAMAIVSFVVALHDFNNSISGLILAGSVVLILFVTFATAFGNKLSKSKIVLMFLFLSLAPLMVIFGTEYINFMRWGYLPW